MEIGGEKERKRFLLEIEQLIRDVNRKIIHERIPKITQSGILPFATTVARMRARYLEAAFRLSALDQDEPIDEQDLKELRRHRELYEEARSAFEALSRAIEQGYLDIEE